MSERPVSERWSYSYMLEELKKYLNDEDSEFSDEIGDEKLSDFIFQFIEEDDIQNQFHDLMKVIMECPLKDASIKDEIAELLEKFFPASKTKKGKKNKKSPNKNIVIYYQLFFGSDVTELNIKTVTFIIDNLIMDDIINPNFLCWKYVDKKSSPWLYEIRTNSKILNELDNKPVRLADIWTWDEYLNYLGLYYVQSTYEMEDLNNAYDFEVSLFDDEHDNNAALFGKKGVKFSLFETFLNAALKNGQTIDYCLQSYVEMIISNLRTFNNFLEGEEYTFKEIDLMIKKGGKYDFKNFILSYMVDYTDDGIYWDVEGKSKLNVEDSYIPSLVKARFLKHLKIDLGVNWKSIKALAQEDVDSMEEKMSREVHLGILKGNSQ